jgi:hypothetical protein
MQRRDFISIDFDSIEEKNTEEEKRREERETLVVLDNEFVGQMAGSV